jgi:sigma-E factor negative regulatory protein RseA
MSREALQESLSAVMDNEADELELRRVLNAVDDAETRATWSRYQVARAAMHKELLLPNLDIASAVSAALADEAVPAKVKQGPWRSIGRLAVAASVTVAVLAGVRCTTRTRSRVPNWLPAACPAGPEHASSTRPGRFGRL